MKPLEPGARIHSDDPFATPEPDRSPVRRLRGRLAGAVTLWTAPGPAGPAGPAAPGAAGPAGLTVSSTLVADGDPGCVLGLIDEESDLWDAVRTGGRFAVTVLGAGHQQLADRFAGVMPAPGGLFAGGAWTDTGFGPVPVGAGTWAGCRLASRRPCGWALLVEGIIDTVHLDSGPAPLMHFRGRYRRLAD